MSPHHYVMAHRLRNPIRDTRSRTVRHGHEHLLAVRRLGLRPVGEQYKAQFGELPSQSLRRAGNCRRSGTDRSAAGGSALERALGYSPNNARYSAAIGPRRNTRSVARFHDCLARGRRQPSRADLLQPPDEMAVRGYAERFRE
jgi:hypothetical protein